MEIIKINIVRVEVLNAVFESRRRLTPFRFYVHQKNLRLQFEFNSEQHQNLKAQYIV